MAQKVIANAPDLRAFASALQAVEAQLAQTESKLKGALNAVSSTWKDPQRDKCAAEIQSLSANLRKFSAAAAAQRSYCAKLAGQIESIG